jgi:hypothetical protein
MKYLLLIIATATLSACASKPKTETIDTNLDKKTELSSNEAVGMKKDQEELVYQKKSHILNDLTRLEEEVYQLQDDVYGTREYNSKGLFGKFLECRKSHAMKTGEMSRIPDKSPVVEKDKVKVAIDQTTGKPIGYTEEALEKRLARFQDYKNTLYDRKEELENLIDKCEVDSSKKDE